MKDRGAMRKACRAWSDQPEPELLACYHTSIQSGLPFLTIGLMNYPLSREAESRKSGKGRGAM